MSQPYDPKNDPDSFQNRRARERGAQGQPYDAKRDPSTTQFRNPQLELAKPVASTLVTGIVLLVVVAPVIWGIGAAISGAVAGGGGDPTAVVVLAGLAAFVVWIVGLVRALGAIRILAARSDRAAAREAAPVDAPVAGA